MNTETYERLVRGEMGCFPLRDRALFRLSGTDRVRFLNGQITNDVTKLRTGHALYGALLTGKGKITSDLFVAAGEAELFIDTPLPLREIARQRMEKFLIADDAVLEDVTDSYRLTHIFGSEWPHGPGFRNHRFGLPGIDLWEGVSDPSRLGDLPMVDAGVVEVLRVEFALGKWAAELDENTLPQEALFERNGLSYEKGCYTGQETVARIRSIGHVNRHLAFLELLEGTAPVLPASLMAESTDTGKLTTLVNSPLLHKIVGLGMVSRKFNQIGQILNAGPGRFRISTPPRLLKNENTE